MLREGVSDKQSTTQIHTNKCVLRPAISSSGLVRFNAWRKPLDYTKQVNRLLAGEGRGVGCSSFRNDKDQDKGEWIGCSYALCGELLITDHQSDNMQYMRRHQCPDKTFITSSHSSMVPGWQAASSPPLEIDYPYCEKSLCSLYFDGCEVTLSALFDF